MSPRFSFKSDLTSSVNAPLETIFWLIIHFWVDLSYVDMKVQQRDNLYEIWTGLSRVDYLLQLNNK